MRRRTECLLLETRRGDNKGLGIELERGSALVVLEDERVARRARRRRARARLRHDRERLRARRSPLAGRGLCLVRDIRIVGQEGRRGGGEGRRRGGGGGGRVRERVEEHVEAQPEAAAFHAAQVEPLGGHAVVGGESAELGSRERKRAHKLVAADEVAVVHSELEQFLAGRRRVERPVRAAVAAFGRRGAGARGVRQTHGALFVPLRVQRLLHRLAREQQLVADAHLDERIAQPVQVLRHQVLTCTSKSQCKIQASDHRLQYLIT